jgi:DNA-binding transcriptional LysR family regulator
MVDDALVAVVSRDDPLAAEQAITIGALRDRPLVSLPTGTGVRAALDAACASAGFTPRIVLEASALPMVAQLASRGLGVAVLPASAAPAGTLHVLPISDPQARSRLELAWNPAAAASPAAMALIEHTRDFARPLELVRDYRAMTPAT